VVSAAAGLTLGLSALLAVFRLLYSEWGIVAGPGWTDVHVRLPGYLVLAVATLVLGLLPLIGPARRWIAGRIESRLAVRRTLLLTTAAAWTATPWPTTTGRLWFRPGKCRRTISRCRVRPSSTGVSSVPTDTA
jgi:uncharacterized membrane protein (UPF0182 family)